MISTKESILAATRYVEDKDLVKGFRRLAYATALTMIFILALALLGVEGAI